MYVFQLASFNRLQLVMWELTGYFLTLGLKCNYYKQIDECGIGEDVDQQVQGCGLTIIGCLGTVVGGYQMTGAMR